MTEVDFQKKLENKLTEAKEIKFIIMAYGVPEKAIILEEESNDTYGNMAESYSLIQNVLDKNAHFNQNKQMKIHVIAAGFYRLRALLQALTTFKQENWEINGQAMYTPDLKKDFEDEDALAEYLIHMIGNLDPNVSVKEIEGVKIYGEIERILNYELDCPSLFYKKIQAEWGQKEMDNLRISLNAFLRYYPHNLNLT